MNIIKVRLPQLESVASLFNDYRRFYQQPSDFDGACQFLRERLRLEDSVIFAAEIDGSFVGFAQLYPSFSSIAMKRLWIVNDLYVHPEFRKKSVARTLLHEARQFAEATGAGSLTLKTALTNEPAQRLYTALGWKKDEVFCSYNLKIERA